MPQVFTSKENIGTLSKTSNTIITLTPSRVTIGGLQYINLANVTINTGTTGIGGLDTGSIQANKVYNVFAVPNSGFLGIIASLNSSPTGYSNFTKIGSFSTNGSSEVTSVWTGDKTLWQKKVMTTNNTPSQMNFNNLEIGKTYKVTCEVRFVLAIDAVCSITINYSGGTISIYAQNYTSGGNIKIAGRSLIFTTTTTMLTFTQSSNTTAATHTYAILEELPLHEQITQWT